MANAEMPLAASDPPASGWLERVRAKVRLRWGRRANRWIAVQVVLLWALAQALPSDVLEQSPLLARLTAAVVTAIPSAASFAARTEFPQVAQVLLALGWLLMVPNVLFGILLPEHLARSRPRKVFGDLDDLNIRGTHSTVFCLVGILWLACVPSLLWMLTAVPVFDPRYGVDDFSAGYAFDHRLTFGFIAQAVSNLMGVLVAFWCVVAGHFIGSFVAFCRRDGSGGSI